MTPTQRRRWALGALVLAILAAGTALQPPPNVGPRECRKDLRPGFVTRDAKRVQVCVLRAGGRVIVVSRVRKGPKRGSIIGLADARRRYRSACVEGPGRDYVVVGDGSRSKPVEGSNASERMIGMAAGGVIDGRLGDDCIDSGPGNDQVKGAGGDDMLFGGPGDDLLQGSGGQDSLHGGPGNDTLEGGPGGDRLFGGPGNDVIRAGAGADVVSAGPGDDDVNAPKPGLRSLNCGPGRDRARVSDLARGRVHNCEVVEYLAG